MTAPILPAMDPPPPPAPLPPGPSLDAAPPPPPPAPALKAAPGKHRDAAPPDDDPSLDAELPVVLQDLVPLSYLIDRVVADAYADLANLVETCVETVRPRTCDFR